MSTHDSRPEPEGVAKCFAVYHEKAERPECRQRCVYGALVVILVFFKPPFYGHPTPTRRNGEACPACMNSLSECILWSRTMLRPQANYARRI